ncbi:MAG TPA: hypothetical protein DCE07_04830 [Peptococcaceae bacterium]|nr:hypothetical protein [Peptococcaceae bacterium]
MAARANGELENYTSRWSLAHEKLKEIARVKVKAKTSPKLEDVEAWLRASLPALKGTSAGAPWVRYVLRELTRQSFSALVS